MGVELGKVLAKNILAQLNGPEDVKGHDSSVCLVSSYKSTLLIYIPLIPDDWSYPLLPTAQEGVKCLSSTKAIILDCCLSCIDWIGCYF